MNSQSFSARPALQVEMNTTPLVDVLLVLLLMFILIAPALSHAIKIDLPYSEIHLADKAEVIVLGLAANGEILWNESAIDDRQLHANLIAAGKLRQVELHIRSEANLRYERLAQIMALAQRNGVNNIGFVNTK